MKTLIKKAAIERIIEEATVDAYDNVEQATGFLCMIEENVTCPFAARVIGETVDVIGFDIEGADTSVLAICNRNGKKYKVGLTSLEWGETPPKGFEWIEA